MFLKEFMIKNFRSFDDIGITLSFNKGINAIIGENNSGKSSVIDAIRIAFSTLSYNRDVYFTKSDFHIKEDGTKADVAEFYVRLADVPKNLIEIWDPCSDSEGEFHITFSKYLSPSGVEKVKYNHWGIGSEGNPLTANTFEAIEIAFLGALRDSESEMRPARNSRLAQLLRNIVPKADEQNDLVNVLISANDALMKKKQINRTRDTINANLSKMEQEILRQQVDIGLVEPRFDSIAAALRAWVRPKWVLISGENSNCERARVFADKNPNCSMVHKKADGVLFDTAILSSDLELDDELKSEITELAGNAFELYQNGLGYNNLLFMSAVLGDMSLEKEGIYENLLLIEEPEAHLHPQLQELVHNFFRNEDQEKSNIQVIYTSHSPTLVSKIDLDNINLLYESDYKKCCLPISRTNLDKDDKIYLQKYLDVTKSQMFFARGILFVEGISEALLFPEFAKLLNRPFDRYAVELVNVGSVAFKPFANLFSSDRIESKWKKLAIVTDDDRCTDKNENYYISKDIDFNELSDDVLNSIENGQPSKRFKEIQKLCNKFGIKIFSVKKTLEYSLCSCDSNISIMLKAIKLVFPEAGIKLEKKVNEYSSLQEKAACIWLFVRARDKKKGELAQQLGKIIEKQVNEISAGKIVEQKFEVPSDIATAIYTVTEKKG